MAYVMIVKLTEQEYERLRAVATQAEKSPENLLHDLILQHPSSVSFAPRAFERLAKRSSC